MSDLSDPNAMPMKPKYQRAIVVLHLGVSREWRGVGKQDLIRAIEKVMGIPGPEVGPGGAVLHDMFIRVEEPEALDPVIEQYRLEFPLVERIAVQGPDGIVRRVEVGDVATEKPQQLPGMWEEADLIGGATDQPLPLGEPAALICCSRWAITDEHDANCARYGSHPGDLVPAYPLNSLEFNDALTEVEDGD